MNGVPEARDTWMLEGLALYRRGKQLLGQGQRAEEQGLAPAETYARAAAYMAGAQAAFAAVAAMEATGLQSVAYYAQRIQAAS